MYCSRVRSHGMKTAVLAVMIGFGATAGVALPAEDLSNSEKIKVIDGIAAKAVGLGCEVDLLDIYLQVSEHMQLDAKDTEESQAMLEKWKREALEKYPGSYDELKKRYEPLAVERFPLYKIGDKIDIIFFLHGKGFPVSGTYYRSNSSTLWVGSKKIARSSLPREIAMRFDRVKTMKLRGNYIEDNIRKYQRKRESYVERMMFRSPEYERKRGNVLYNGKWFSPRKLTEMRVKDFQNNAEKKFNETVAGIQNKDKKDLERIQAQYENTVYMQKLSEAVDSEMERRRQEGERRKMAESREREHESLMQSLRGAPQDKEPYGAVWILRNKGNLHKTASGLQAEGFQYDPRYNRYWREPVPNAVRMEYWFDNTSGKVKKVGLNLLSTKIYDPVKERWDEYTSNFERILKNRVNAAWVTTTVQSRVSAYRIRIYDLKDYHFLVGVTIYSFKGPYYFVGVTIFSKDFYPDADSAVASY